MTNATRRTSNLARWGALLLFAFASTKAHAGRGKFTPGSNEPTTVSMTIHLTFPPTHDKLDEIAEKLRRGSRMFCDATDGAIQISEFKLERNGLSTSEADVIWLPVAEI